MKGTRLVVVALLGTLCVAGHVRGQNDWQYPDPYFGILEIEKSHAPAADRRSRQDVGPTNPPAAKPPVRRRAPRPRPFARWIVPAR